MNTTLYNTIKILFYKENPSILNQLDFDNDKAFLEPLLFAYFNSRKENLFSPQLLEEIMQGYFVEKKPPQIAHSYNKNGKAYLPEIGYFKKRTTEMVEPILKIEDFEILKEIHPVLEKYFVEFYKGHVLNENPEHEPKWKEGFEDLSNAIGIIKKHLPKFYQELIFANKKIYLHDNPKILNFTSVETLGMLYFYIIGKNNLLYFIEELIHQGSHNYLYYVIHNRKEYFKVDVDNLVMRDFTKQNWDYRTIYGAFHGLYTVTKRVECFDVLLSKNVFCGEEKHELLGRFSDQFSRFRTGLELLDQDEILTEKGKEFYRKLDTKCATILKKYSHLKNIFDLSNRDLDFRYDDFCILNPYHDFLKLDEQNYFNPKTSIL